jgi:hypothetical protein
MATMTRMQPYYVGSTIHQSPKFVGGGEGPEFIEVASSTWGVGDLLYLDSNGKLAICTTSSSKLNSAIAGQATKAATGTTSAAVHFRAIRPDDLFVMNVYHGTAASAVTNQNQVGVTYGIILNSSKWHVDIENTTIEDGTTALGKVQIVGFPTYSPDSVRCTIGDTYGLVLVKFLPFTIATDGSPFTRNLQLA